MKKPPFDPLIACTEAAEYLAVHPRELRRMATLREIASVRRGRHGHLKFRLSELNRWAEHHTTPARRAS